VITEFNKQASKQSGCSRKQKPRIHFQKYKKPRRELSSCYLGNCKFEELDKVQEDLLNDQEPESTGRRSVFGRD